MENFLPKMTQVGEDDKKQVYVRTNVRQFEGQSLRVPKQEKSEARNVQEQALPMALHSMQEKMDQNSKEMSTKVSHILKKLESVDKELAATKSDNLTTETLQIDVIDDMKDAIGELQNNVGELIVDLRMNKDYTSALAYQLSVVKDDLKNVTDSFEDFQLKEYLKDGSLEYDILEVNAEISQVRNQMTEVREDVSGVIDKLKDFERRGDEILENDNILEVQCEVSEARDSMKDLDKQGDELVDVKTALKSLKDDLKNVTNELKTVKDVTTNLGNDVRCELNNVKEELRVVKEKSRVADTEQNEIVGVQDFMLFDLRKLTDEVSCVKQDLQDICDELRMDVGSQLQNVRHKLKSMRHETRAAKDELREFMATNLNLIKEFNDTIRSAQMDLHVQNVKPTSNDPREGMTNLISNKKRKQDSKDPIFKQNKRLQKQSNRGEERGAAFVSSAPAFRMSTSSLDSDSR